MRKMVVVMVTVVVRVQRELRLRRQRYSRPHTPYRIEDPGLPSTSHMVNGRGRRRHERGVSSTMCSLMMVHNVSIFRAMGAGRRLLERQIGLRQRARESGNSCCREFCHVRWR